jgi:hypothetical protein
MGGAPKKIARATKKTLQKAEKALVEPLERPVKKAVNVVEKVGADIVEPLEKPVKKLIREVKETVTGTDKYDYRQPEQPAQSPEITPEVVEDESPTITTRYATRGKRSGQGGTIMEGYGVVTRPPSKRSVT